MYVEAVELGTEMEKALLPLPLPLPLLMTLFACLGKQMHDEASASTFLRATHGEISLTDFGAKATLRRVETVDAYLESAWTAG
jgi:hypothetical protein